MQSESWRPVRQGCLAAQTAGICHFPIFYSLFQLSSLGVAMLPPGCQLPEDIECCSAQEEGRHGHDFLIPKSPADLENKEIQRSFERLQAEMQELVAKDPQSPSDVRFVDDNLEDDDISMLKSPERLVSPTGKLSEADQQKPEIGVEPTGESQLRSPDSNNKTSGSDTTKLSQLCDQFSAKRKRSQSQGRTTSTYSAGPSHQPPTRGTGSSSVFSFMLESSLKESELSFAPDGSKCTSQAKLGFNDLQSAEVANITKASLRSGKLINNNNNSDRLPGEAESEGFKTVSSGSATPAREDQEVQELMNTSGPSCNVGGGGGPSEPRFFLRSSSCWKQTNNCDPSASALNVALKVEPVEEKLLPNGVSRDGCPYLFRLRPKRAPIKVTHV